MESSKTNQFAGLSTLRAQERAKKPPTEKAKALEAYLRKYADNPGDQEGKKKRKKKQPKPLQGVTIIDENTTGFKLAPAKKARHEEEQEGSDEDAPVVANPGEADLYARLLEKERAGAANNWASVDEEGNSLSAGRRQTSLDGEPDTSPPRRVRHDSPDASPPRRIRHDSPDTSPPRRVRHDSPDASPPRRMRHDSPDASPPRRRREVAADGSPALQLAAAQARPDPAGAAQPSGSGRSTSRGQHGAAKKLSNGVTAGMISSEALNAHLTEKKAAEVSRLQRIEAASGPGAETVYRDKETGRRMTRAEFEAAQKAAADKKPKYETPEWGGGVKQMRDREVRAAEMAKEASRQFARTREDVDDDLNLRERSRFGDPMAHLVKKRAEAPPPPAVPAHLAKQMKKSGFVVPQEVPNHSWLRRNMGAPPNRYGIKPGRHWDGVDRSTGFERDMFKQQAARVAQEREARMWAQSDM